MRIQKLSHGERCPLKLRFLEKVSLLLRSLLALKYTLIMKKWIAVHPHQWTVPYNKKFKLTLKREGYFDKKVTLSPQSLKHMINFPLEKKEREGKRNHAPIIIK